jgi:hypothetical protein
LKSSDLDVEKALKSYGKFKIFKAFERVQKSSNFFYKKLSIKLKKEKAQQFYGKQKI